MSRSVADFLSGVDEDPFWGTGEGTKPGMDGEKMEEKTWTKKLDKMDMSYRYIIVFQYVLYLSYQFLSFFAAKCVN